MRSVIVVLSIVTAALAGSALAAKEKAKETDVQQPGSTSSHEEVRNWSKIDTDHDGYVQPEEMEKYLQAVWAQHGKNTAADQKPGKTN